MLRDPRKLEFLRELAVDLSENLCPNISRVAAKCGISVSTAWRIYKSAVSSFETLVKAICHYPNLRLKPVFVVLKPRSKSWLEHAARFLYVTYITVGYDRGEVGLMQLSTPPELVEETLKAVESHLGEVLEFYVFERALVGVPDFSALAGDLRLDRIETRLLSKPVEKVSFDRLDLEILAMLQKRPYTPSELASALGVGRKTLEYRLKRRVSKLIEGFTVHLMSDRLGIKSVIFAKGDPEDLLPLACLPFPHSMYVSDELVGFVALLPCNAYIELLKQISKYSEWVEYMLDPRIFKRYSVLVRALEKGQWARRVLEVEPAVLDSENAQQRWSER